MSAVPAQEPITQRAIVLADAEACHRLSVAVGWLHRIEDWRFSIGLGQGVVLCRGREVVATACWWPFGSSHATVGHIIVAPALQGAGLGKRLMQAIFAANDGRTLMLNATEAGAPLYAKTGFVASGGITQHQGKALPCPAPVLASDERLRVASVADLAALSALDIRASGLPRDHVLATLLDVGEIVMLERGGVAGGFGGLRRFGKGFVIGPVVAGGLADARSLIGHWLHGRDGEFMRIDIPTGCGLGGWLEQAGLPVVSTVGGMVRGEPPVATGPAMLLALVNQALG
jgi:hypothetical protein